MITNILVENSNSRVFKTLEHLPYYCVCCDLTLNLMETRFNAFANRADQDQAALVRAAWSGSTLFAYGNISDPTLVDLTSNVFALCTNMFVCLI